MVAEIRSADEGDLGSRWRWSRLWQVPAFLIGVSFAICLFIYRPFHRAPDRARLFDNEIGKFRQALDGPNPNTAHALALGEHLVARLGTHPDRAAEVHFLLGSAYLRRASETSPEQAPFAWQSARSHLETATKLGVTDAHARPLAFRLAVAWWHTGVEPQRVLEALLALPENAGGSSGQYYTILEELYLRLPTPNLKAALEANAKLLALPSDNDDLLAPALLFRGEVLFQMSESDDARRVLARVRPTADKTLFTRARLLRARSFQKDRIWSGAAPLWEDIIKAAGPRTPDPPSARLLLSLCYHQMNRRADAVRLLSLALEDGPDVNQAASLWLGALRAADSDSAAIHDLEHGLSSVARPNDYRNSLVDLAEARRLVRQAYQALVTKRRFELAERAARLLGKIEPAASVELVGANAESWARDCLKQAEKQSGPAADALRQAAAAHWRDAGGAFAEVAAAKSKAVEQASWWWRSARCSLRGDFAARAIPALRQFIAVEKDHPRLGEGWYALAVAYRTLKNQAEAKLAFHKAIEYGGPFALRARYELAQADIDEGKAQHNATKLEEAEAALLQNLDLMHASIAPEAHEKTLRALATLLLDRGNYRMAVIRLQEVLDRYPKHEGNVETRRQLADAYRRLAAREDQNLRAGLYLSKEGQLLYREQRQQWLQKALAQYHKLADDLVAEGTTRTLSPAEEQVLRAAAFAAGDCFFESGLYLEAIRWYEKWVERYHGRTDALAALKQITRCYWMQRDETNARAAIQRLRLALRDTPDQAFSDRPEDTPRAEWNKWLEWAEKQ